ncbi:SAF domain-containing protein [Sanguibacter sp. A247]|uniref:SAF domain-containing protein n=1 Tax=unclassified Sanguibacter TaxID=2645534 RepID=UPI003FD85DDF
MNRPAAPGAPALRLQRPGWKDPRLVVGVLLVAASVALGSWSVRVARQTEPVVAALTDLPAGHVLTAADVRTVEVALGETSERYLSASAAIDGAVLSRPVGAGELIPSALLVAEATAGLRTVAMGIPGPLPADVLVGGLVDLWVLPEPATRDARGDAAQPVPHAVAHGLDVTAVTAETGAFGSGLGTGTTVEVRVAEAELPQVLAALSADGALALVAAPVGPAPAAADAPAGSAGADGATQPDAKPAP